MMWFDMYCQNHDVVGCSKCFAVDHKQCEVTFHIQPFLKPNKNASGSKSIQNLETTTDIKKEEIIPSQGEDLCLQKTKEITKTINQRRNVLRRKPVKAGRGKFTLDLDKLDEHIEQIEETETEAISDKVDLEARNDKESEVFNNSDKGENVADFSIKHIKETIAEIKEEEEDPNQSFVTGPDKTNQSEECDTSRQNNDETVCQEVEVLGQNTQRGSETQAISDTIKERNILLKVKEKKEFTIRMRADGKKCDIYSACNINDKTLILADRNNRKLKRVDRSTYSVTDSCDITGDLYQVCKISDNEVAVSCGWKSFIQFVAIESKMVPTRQIKTDHWCKGLACVTEHVYISSSTAVYMYTLSGNKLLHFIKDNYGQNLFSNIFSLTVSSDGAKIYVADRNNGLIALDKGGNVFGKFNGKELECVEDVCIMENGNVLACGYGSKNVLQFTADCEKIGEVVKSHIGCPALCYDPGQSKLVLACDELHNIDVYDTN